MQLRPYRFSIFILMFSLVLAQPSYGARKKKFSIPSIADSHMVIGQGSEFALNPNSIKVLNWNIYKAARKKWYGDFLNLSQNMDILALQEIYLDNRTEAAFSVLNQFRYDFGISFIYNRKDYTPTGSMVASKVQPSFASFERTIDLEPIIKTPKTITYAKYPIAQSNKELLVLSIHSINLGKYNAFVRQLDQSIPIIQNHEGPIIFAGDFNTWSKKRLSHLRSFMKGLGLTEVSFRYDQKRKKFFGYLDHVFVKDLLIRDSVVKKDIKSSDHKPMIMDFVYNP